MTTPGWLLATFDQTAAIYLRVPVDADEYGNPVYELTPTGQVSCRLEPLSAAEYPGGRSGTATHTLYLPAEAAGLVDTFSLIVIDGVEYEVDGPPQRLRQLFSPSLHHLEVNLLRSTA